MQNFAARARYGQARHLWGNVPAVDVLNLEKNEGVGTDQDFNLAWVASGDLRDVIRTVNSLPETYTGHLTILLNDRDPVVTVRNLLILLILGRPQPSTTTSSTNHENAAELALHLWYSAFVPATHASEVMKVVLGAVEELKKPTFNVKLGVGVGGKERSSLRGSFEEKQILGGVLAHLTAEYGFEQAQKEYQRVFLAPEREDLIHRFYRDLEPSHRLAYDHFRRFGLLLPFGAPNAHFNQPNRFLFSREGEWYQYDGSNPMDSWDTEEVLAAGKANGVHRADLFGSLYFYLSHQLRSFASRLHHPHMRITIHMLSADAKDVPASILRSTTTLTQNILFDRIDLSNVVDHNYLGLEGTLGPWGVLLNGRRNKYATVCGYFMNWFMVERRAEPSYMGAEGMARWVKGKMDQAEISLANIIMKGDHNTTIYEAIYDNSGPFVEYLNKMGAAKHAQAGKLKMKTRHTILPYRLLARLGDPSNALPYLPDEESWSISANALLQVGQLNLGHLEKAEEGVQNCLYYQRAYIVLLHSLAEASHPELWILDLRSD
ncbi:hypothetical protein EIP91_003644 [Steccherinum ochraceum]|uniref:DUF4470 domain-containing protein n=1 Tax=Steccherinum ochraceum TaxID=92696 RepID=A0A4R0RQT9_9APHY|nr:hypothetical protein EIP91_003644 [Steccherinum ochraceum]